MKWAIAIAAVLAVWALASVAAGGALVPSPLVTGREIVRMLGEGAVWRDASITLFRGAAGLALAFVVGLALGIPCGLNRAVYDVLSSVMFAVQGCPTILWISLLMVWVGLGSVVPIVAVFLATVPVLFMNAAQGTASLDPRLFAMARVYRASRWRVIRRIILPGLSSYVLAGFSFALGVSWKVTATAEFIASSSGIGSRIYWSYRLLDMNRLFGWAVILIGFGMFLEMKVIRPLRRRVEDERRSAGG